MQKLVPWIVELNPIPKGILSLLIVGLALLFLSLIWTSPSAAEKRSLEVIGSILETCYRRSVFTRTHAQMSHEAMFNSISNCRQYLQQQIPNISNTQYSQQASNILAALESIERERNQESLDFDKIDQFKLEALRGFKYFEKETKKPFPIPNNLTEEIFFSQEDANKPPTITIQTD